MSRPETCDRCKEEVRHGVRNGVTGWWHREEVDHIVRFGAPGPTPAESAEIRRAAYAELGIPDPQSEKEQGPVIIPDPEVRPLRLDPDIKRVFLATPDGLVEVTFPGGAKTLVNAARKTGWDFEATYARGPWMHASQWTVTGIVDHVVLRLSRGEQRAVATWRDGKLESSWYWTTRPGTLEAINSKDLRERIKT